MRDGRRKRLGLVEGSEGTVGDTYLDRILSEAGPDTLMVGPDGEDASAYVDTGDQRYINDAYLYNLYGRPAGDVASPAPPPSSGGGDGGGGGGGGGTTPTTPGANTPFVDLVDPNVNINEFAPEYQGTPGGNTGSGDFDLIDNSGKSFGPYSQTPVTPNETSLGNTNTGLEDYLNIDYTTPVNTPSGRNPFGYEDLNPSALAGPGINETSGLDDIGADIGVDNTVDYGMPQGSPGQLNPAAPSIDFKGGTLIQDSPDMDDGIGLTRQELYEQQDTSLTETLKNKFGSLLPENFNVGTAIGKIFVNSIVGKPITLAFDIAKSIFGMLPEGGRSDLSDRLGEQYGMDDIGRLTGGPMEGYSVGPDFAQTVQDRIDNINETLSNMTSEQLATTTLKDRVENLKEIKAETIAAGTGGVITEPGTVLGPGEFLPEGEELVTKEEQDAINRVESFKDYEGVNVQGDGSEMLDDAQGVDVETADIQDYADIYEPPAPAPISVPVPAHISGGGGGGGGANIGVGQQTSSGGAGGFSSGQGGGWGWNKGGIVSLKNAKR